MTTIISILIGAISTLTFGGFMIFVGAVLGALFGGVTGWCVGLAFPYVITNLGLLLGVQLTGWQAGALLGFVSGFFRPVINKNKDDNT